MKLYWENHPCFLVLKWNMYAIDSGWGKFCKFGQFLKGRNTGVETEGMYILSLHS